METGIATQLITVSATLAGVVLTLFANAFLERRRADDTRWLESARLASQRATWLRDERQKAYGNLSIAGEDALRFIRTELPTLVGSSDARLREDAEVRWREFHTALRKAYNQVELFGADEARAAAVHIWRTARNGVNSTLQALDAADPASTSDLLKKIRTVASDLGTVGDRYLEACRKDLQGAGADWTIGDGGPGGRSSV
jgi:hypothetical protein